MTFSFFPFFLIPTRDELCRDNAVALRRQPRVTHNAAYCLSDAQIAEFMKRRSIDARHNPCHTGIIYDVPVTRLIYRVLLDEKLPFQKFQIVSGIVQANRLSICIESFSSKFLRKKKKNIRQEQKDKYREGKSVRMKRLFPPSPLMNYIHSVFHR